MPRRKHPPSPPLSPAEQADIEASVLDFIRRGQRAQAAVDVIVASEPERRRKQPKGNA